MASFITTITSPISSSSSSNPSFPKNNTKTRFQPRRWLTSSIYSSSKTQPSIFTSSSFLSPSSPSPWISSERGLRVITRAVPPSTNQLIFAFVMPITLVLATVFASIRIADKLDEDYLEELMQEQAMLQGKEIEEVKEDESTMADNKNDTVPPTWQEEKSTTPRIRNRPKREAEV